MLKRGVVFVKLAVPFELRIFLVVVLVGAVSLLVILDKPSRDRTITAEAISGLQQPLEPANTVIISGIDIGDPIGSESPTLSGNELACLSDKIIITDRGKANARFFLKLREPGDFDGCKLEFAETEARKTGLFIRCPSEDDAFAFIIQFNPSLDSDIEDGELEDIREETIPILGMPYTIVKAQVNTGARMVRLLFFSPQGTLDIEDKYDDSEFSTAVEANGQRVFDARARITGFVDGDEFRMTSIEYRLMPQPQTGRDVFVGVRQGVKQHLRSPAGFLGDFDILFRGIGGTLPKVSVPAPKPQQAGNVIAFDAVGDDTYMMMFTNNRGQTYRFPLISNVGGVLKFGDEDQDFLFTGAGGGPPFNIDLKDLFAVTNRADRQGVTNIVEYSAVDVAQGNAYFNDLAGGQTVGHFDTTTGDGSVVIGGTEYDFRVDLAAPHSITVDQDNDGALGDEAEIVTAGGPRIDLSAGGTGALEIDEVLFAEEAPAGGETINFAFTTEGNDIDVDVTSGVTMIKNDLNKMLEGLTTFGVFVQLDDKRNTARDLIFALPGRGTASIGTPNVAGQALGQVLVTCERSEFVRRAREAKVRAAGQG